MEDELLKELSTKIAEDVISHIGNENMVADDIVHIISEWIDHNCQIGGSLINPWRNEGRYSDSLKPY